jgi:hypothetical protein
MAKAEPITSGKSASRLIDQRIRDLGDWRGSALSRMRTLIMKAVPAMTEEWKGNCPAWSCDGVVCVGETHAKVVRLSFARGADVPDRTGLFNGSLEGTTRRTIDLREGEMIDAGAFERLIKVAVVVNGAAALLPRSTKNKTRPLKLIPGDNPHVAKGDGDVPVQAYIAAMPSWKREVGSRLDALIARVVPGVTKAVRWNSAVYGIEGQDWFLGMHVFMHYVKVNFFRGNSLRPMPPGCTAKSKDARWIDIREGALDEQQIEQWVKQAAALPS